LNEGADACAKDRAASILWADHAVVNFPQVRVT
jgi:hypothetical protein